MAAKSTRNEGGKEDLLKNLPERMDIRVDWAFKHFFGKKKHLIKIIKDLLDMDIEVIEYMPNGLDVATEQDKKSVFDVICKDTRTDEVFVLEMQTTYESDMTDRLYYYGGSLIHSQMSSGAKKYAIRSVSSAVSPATRSLTRRRFRMARCFSNIRCWIARPMRFLTEIN